MFALLVIGMLTLFGLGAGSPSVPPGRPETHGGSYYVDIHGALTAVPESAYWYAVRHIEQEFFDVSLFASLSALLAVGMTAEWAEKRSKNTAESS